MPRRRITNKHLPERLYKHGKKWRYHHKDGRRTAFSGYLEACVFAARENAGLNGMNTMTQVFDRYEHEILPTLAESSQRSRKSSIKRLTKAFGKVSPGAITTQHVYQYLDARSAKPSAGNSDIACLSAVFTKAIRWGAAEKNPCLGVEKNKTKPRDRYVTDAEFWAVHEMANARIQLAMELSLLTGLRPGDILRITRENLTDEGILVTPQKTQNSSNVSLLIEWSDELRDVVYRAKKIRPQVRQYLICNAQGKHYKPLSFSKAWGSLMRQAEKRGIARFQFRDIRAKSASDDTLERASDRLGHTNKEITQRVYVRTPRSVKPLR